MSVKHQQQPPPPSPIRLSPILKIEGQSKFLIMRQKKFDQLVHLSLTLIYFFFFFALSSQHL